MGITNRISDVISDEDKQKILNQLNGDIRAEEKRLEKLNEDRARLQTAFETLGQIKHDYYQTQFDEENFCNRLVCDQRWRGPKFDDFCKDMVAIHQTEGYEKLGLDMQYDWEMLSQLISGMDGEISEAQSNINQYEREKELLEG